MKTTDPRFEIISRMKLGESTLVLAQFTPAENEAAASVVQEIHDYNLDLRPKPDLPPDILAKASEWAEIRMAEQVAAAPLQRKQAEV